ncbi:MULTISPECIES: TonB-dependent siderophore receptor [Vibrio]|uniref:TonB-dependent siderophore receptor n=1 Tax=Vibrio TaxID=662 RepID=UPI002074CCFB|nr:MULTISPECIES: TonB-dependent siderophore receptor [Vibrio]USD31279.1 TonB-dependent siderophore receptor [Vibrio sp. SCSIO 43186]USD44324.1 TonB-dependent siderophore receptor [Vibrio sp. SCSIO 43145]USD68402.1 TonB-dependent siderophore receptor [Vibrio sp. SCSIO 43139]USD96087.1 TonB-dependent siderophore receptor [Vibrio coralliilyticus]
MNRQFLLSPACLAVAFALSAGAVNAAEDETVVVIGQEHDSAVGPDFSYLGQKSRTATKTDLAIHETPRAVSVVTREQMDDRASISISDALQYTPGIQANFYGEDNKQDWFVIRGFTQANNGLYQDGTRLYSAGFYSWQIDPFALERVEILRGPASVLYGQNPPGGLINTVSKRPQFDGGSGQVAVEYGSYDRTQISLDVNRELNEDVAFRLVAMGRKNGTKVDNVDAERILIAPSLAWNINDSSSITFLTSYQKDDSDPYLQFLPMEGTLTSNPNGTISDDVAVGNPDWEKFEREQLSLGYEFEHQFNSALSFGQSARYSRMDIDLRQIYANGYAADSDLGAFLDPTNSRQTIVRGVTTEQGHSDAFNIDNRVVYSFNTGKLSHTLLAGADYQSIKIDSKDFAGKDPIVADGNGTVNIPAYGIGDIADPSFNIFNPSYTNNVVLLDSNSIPFPELNESDMQTTITKNSQLGLYIQDQIRYQNWVLQAGVRYDDTSNEQSNQSTGNTYKADYKEWTSSAAVAYVMSHGFTPYFSYSQSFEPVIKTVNDQAANPERGEAFEAGVKYQPRSFDGYFNLSVYEATKKDVVQSVNSEIKQIGEIRNRGMELGAVANVTQALTLIGNLSYVDSEIKDDTNSAIIGNQPQQVADTTASAWAKYQFFGGTFDGLSIGGGVRYTSDSYAGNDNANTVPSYTLYDATVSYRIDDYKFQVAAKNIFDKKYIATCTGNTWCYYGDSRNVIASLSYDW